MSGMYRNTSLRGGSAHYLYEPEQYPTPAGAALQRVLPLAKEFYPEFPEISFEQFLELCREASKHFQYEPQLEVRLYTKSCIAFYFKDPGSALKSVDRRYITSGKYQSDMFDLRFIHTENLATELQEFLRAMGYADADTSFISGLGRILPDGRGRKPDQHWKNYYTPDTKDLVRRNDWAVFEMFPEFDVT